MDLGGSALPDLAGRVALVTGASNGVGSVIAHELARVGAKVLLPVRDRAKGERTVEQIRESVPDADIELHDLDLARLGSVHSLTDTLLTRGRPLDLLVLNAGIVMLGDPHRHVTVDGYELHFQTNFLGHAALTLGLLPLLPGGRVVAQLSIAARTGRLNSLDPQLLRRYKPFRAYASSKVALGAFAVELARRSGAEGLDVTVQLCHPGVAPETGIAGTLRESRGDRPISRTLRALSNTPQAAAHPALLAAVTDAAPPSLFTPHRPGQLAGRAVRSRLYRTLRHPAHGSITWKWAGTAMASR